MLQSRWNYLFAFQNWPAFLLNSTFTHHEIHGRLPLKTGALLHWSHWPDICASYPGGGPAGWDLLSDYEATDWEQKQVLPGCKLPAPAQPASGAGGIRNSCCICDAVGTGGRINKCWNSSFFPLLPGCAVGLTFLECSQAGRGQRAPSIISPELLPCSHQHSVPITFGVRQASCHWGSPPPEAVSRGNTT